MPPRKTVFHIALHPSDAARIVALATRCGVEPVAFVALAATRYADLVERGYEAPWRCDGRMLERITAGD